MNQAETLRVAEGVAKLWATKMGTEVWLLERPVEIVCRVCPETGARYWDAAEPVRVGLYQPFTPYSQLRPWRKAVAS